MPTSDDRLMALDRLRAGYEGEEKLHGVSAELRAGELTVVIGPNGCGKSTLLKCAAGQIAPSSGAVLLEGRSLRDIPRLERARQIAYMPQSRLVPEIPVRQLVMHGRYPHLRWGQRPGAEDRRVAREAVERVGLADKASRPVHELSGGERQRAYIAMMLAQQARVMLLDEPMTYLDPSGQFALMDLLRSLSASGVCVVAVLHDLNLAMRYADRLLMLEGGNPVFTGDPEALYCSGQLERTFRVRVKRVEGQYLFFPGSDQPQ